MKQLWFAAGLLAALLTVTLVSGRYIQSFSDGLTEALVQSQDLARTGHWGQAEQQTQNAYQRWQDNHFYLHTVMQHSDTDQILRKFREVLEYLQIYLSRIAMCEQAAAFLKCSFDLVINGQPVNNRPKAAPKD